MTTITHDNFTGKNHEGPYVNTPVRYLTASSIVGDKVHDKNDVNIGTIKDIMLDVSTGQIDYYIVQTGGLLGVGIKYFAIPYNYLRVDAERRLFLFDQEKEILENAPGFDLNHWPDTNFHLQEDYWTFV